MRILALDIGEQRIGLAVSDPQGTVATPLKVLPARDVLERAPAFRRILEDYEPELLVVGLPRSLDGKEYAQAAKVRRVAERIARQNGLPLAYVDERLSSAEAKRILRANGYDQRTMRGKTDMIAASLFLQTYLEGNQDQHG